MLELTKELKAAAGLAVKHYPYKWKCAKQMAESHHLELLYWERVRLLYLELGGLRVDQLTAKQKVLYMRFECNA